MKDRDARLGLFFGAYFNQDWDVEGAESWMDVVTEYVKDNTRSQVLTLRDDLRSWSSEASSESYVGTGLPSAFGCDYDPRADGLNEREWVRRIIEFLDNQLSN